MEEILRNVELLEGLDGARRGRLAAIARPRALRPGEYLFLLGDAADRLFIVLEGEMELCFPLRVGGAMSDVAVEHIRPGGTLGWSALVKPHRFTLSARAARASRLAGFMRNDLLAIFEGEPAMGYLFMRRINELLGIRLLRMQALWARELQRAVAPASDRESQEGLA